MKIVSFEFDNGQEEPNNISSVGGIIYTNEEWEAMKVDFVNDASFVIHSEDDFILPDKQVEEGGE